MKRQSSEKSVYSILNKFIWNGKGGGKQKGGVEFFYELIVVKRTLVEAYFYAHSKEN